MTHVREESSIATCLGSAASCSSQGLRMHDSMTKLPKILAERETVENNVSQIYLTVKPFFLDRFQGI
jgi:hypothetical protein